MVRASQWVLRGVASAMMAIAGIPVMAAVVSDVDSSASSSAVQALPPGASSAQTTNVAPGTVILEVNRTTGEVSLVGNGVNVLGYEVDSGSGNPSFTHHLNPAGWRSLASQGIFAPGSDSIAGTSDIVSEFSDAAHLWTVASGTSSAVSITQPGQQLWKVGSSPEDLVFSWTDSNFGFHDSANPGSNPGAVVLFVSSVPEPTAITGLALGGALALLGGRKRRIAA